MDEPSALSSLCVTAPLSSDQAAKQQQPARQATPVSKPRANSTVTILPTPTVDSANANASLLASLLDAAEAPLSPLTPPHDGYSTPTAKLERETPNQTQEMPSPSPMSSTGKRKRLDLADDLLLGPTPTKRKGSSDYLRKGQWTSTEERLTRLLIEAFEDGYLPIYTGIRLRGYLAVQLQCDPMRVSKKLCAGTIDGKPVPKNYGQKKFKLRKKPFWDCEEAEGRISELERLTKALWIEARMRKPSFLTLSCTRNVSKRRDSDGEDDSPPSPTKGRSSSYTPKSKKQKVFPIIYLNLSKLKHYSVRGLDDSSDSEPTSPSMESDSDGEPVRLDGESLQAAYDLLTLCSPRSTKKSKSKKAISKKTTSKKDASKKDASMKNAKKDAPTGETSNEAKHGEELSSEEKIIPEKTMTDTPSKNDEDSLSKNFTAEDATSKESTNSETSTKEPQQKISSVDVSIKDASSEDIPDKDSPDQDVSIKSEPCPCPSMSSV